MPWELKTELIGSEPVDIADPEGDKTELTEITATHIETKEVYHLKARMGTEAYKKAGNGNGAHCGKGVQIAWEVRLIFQDCMR